MSATNPNVPEDQVKDRQVARAVEELLMRDANVNAQDINVDVQNGQVVLTGTAGTLREKETAGELAKKANGAVFVENDIVISVDSPLKDPKIEDKISDALGNFPDYDPASVGARIVEDGVVYITGSVISVSEKRQAEEIVSRIKGVRQVINEIVIAPGEPLNDTDIHNMVTDAISDDPRIDPFEVEVEVKNGDVSLTGWVRDRTARDACTEKASEVPGVKAVFNGLNTRQSS